MKALRAEPESRSLVRLILALVEESALGKSGCRCIQQQVLTQDNRQSLDAFMEIESGDEKFPDME